MSTSGNTTDLVFDVTGYFMPDTAGATYHPLTPARVLDTRNGIGLSAKLSANTPVTFQVTGAGHRALQRHAVTGNVTVTGSTSGWAVYLGPVSTAYPTSSTINFSAGQIMANGLTVALSTLRHPHATYMSTTGQHDRSRLRRDRLLHARQTGCQVRARHSGAPARHPHTTPALPARCPRTRRPPSWCRATASCPPTPSAVTGNVTVVNETSGWAVFLGPAHSTTPATSTINFTTGQVMANGLTVGPQLRTGTSDRHLHLDHRPHDRSRLRRHRLLRAIARAQRLLVGRAT